GVTIFYLCKGFEQNVKAFLRYQSPHTDDQKTLGFDNVVGSTSRGFAHRIGNRVRASLNVCWKVIPRARALNHNGFSHCISPKAELAPHAADGIHGRVAALRNDNRNLQTARCEQSKDVGLVTKTENDIRSALANGAAQGEETIHIIHQSHGGIW